MQDGPIPTSEVPAIARAYTMLASEMGHIAAATALYGEIAMHYGADAACWFLKANGRAFPILAALANEGGTHRIAKRINDVNGQLASILRDKESIVCVGAEAAWLDIAAPMYPEKTFYVVPHSPEADLERVVSNYAGNVRIHDSILLYPLYGSSSVIVTFAFGVAEDMFFTYPVVYRICGRDTRQTFSGLIALDILDCPLSFYPYDLVEIATHDFTQVLSRSYESPKRSRRWTSATY